MPLVLRTRGSSVPLWARSSTLPTPPHLRYAHLGSSDILMHHGSAWRHPFHYTSQPVTVIGWCPARLAWDSTSLQSSRSNGPGSHRRAYMRQCSGFLLYWLPAMLVLLLHVSHLLCHFLQPHQSVNLLPSVPTQSSSAEGPLLSS